MSKDTLTSSLTAGLVGMLRDKKVSPSEAVSAYLKRIEQVNPKVNAVTSVDSEGALNRARALEKQDPQSLSLYGLPILLKENICVIGQKTQCASKILEGFRPPYDATVVERLNQAGAVIIGTANMDEFAFGSSCETSCHGATHKPWDTKRIPGGSSGGSAAAVAAELAPMALGSDTGGSIRQPAALCGVVGVKPTYGRVSRYGLVAFGSSLDQIGPLTKDVEGAALLLSVIAGHDPKDSTSVNKEVEPYTQATQKPVKGMKLGIPREYFANGLDPEVQQSLDEALGVYKKMGLSVQEISLPHTQYAVPTYYIVATAEASSNLARFDGVRYGLRVPAANTQEMIKKTRGQGFGPEAKRRIILGTYVLSHGYYDAYYLKALKVRTLIRQDFDEAFKSVDAVLTPATPTPAFGLGEKTDDPLQMYLSDIFTISANLAGVPAMTLPCGTTKAGLPIGMQLMSPVFTEERLFQLGAAYQKETDWHTRRPSLA